MMEISTKNRTELKSYFVQNSIPTEGNFAELIDGMLNLKDDGIVKLPDNPLCIEAAGNEGSSKNALSFYRNFDELKPDWTFNLKPRSDDSSTTKSGFNISDGEDNSRLFIDQSTGNIGIGTTEPAAKLDIQQAARTGSHPSSIKGLYITGDFGEDNDGIEFRKSDGTQGIGFGYNTIYATGVDVNQSLFLKAQGTGRVQVAGTLQADQYVVQDEVDGGSAKGIRMWEANNPNWGIYMSTSGTDKSLANGTAVGGQGFSSHAIRLRTRKNDDNGLIYENNAEELNFSVRSSDGLTYIRGNLGIGKAPACKLDVDGEIKATGGLRVDGDGTIDHINADGAFYRHDGQVYITVDDNLYIRDTDGNVTAYFDTDNGSLGISADPAGAKLHVANYVLENAAFQPLLKLTAYQSDESLDNAFDESKPSYGLEFHRKWHTGNQHLQAGIYAWGTHGWGSGLAFRTALDDTTLSTRMVITDQGNIGIGTTNPVAKLDIQQTARTGTHPASLKGLYITGDFDGDSNGIEFRHSNGAQGIGFGYNTIYATGADANQSLFLKARGTGQVKVAGTLQADNYVVQNRVDGGNTKGIRMWGAGDSNWGIYMGTSGANKSLAGNTAVGGQGFDSYAIRFRTNNTNSEGLIYENNAEQLNFSVRASDGLTYIRGSLGVGKAPEYKLDVDGAIRATGGLCVRDDGTGTINHIDTDGAFYRHDGQVYITVDDNLYIRDTNGNIAAHFDTDNGRLGIGTTYPGVKLDVNGTIRSKSGGFKFPDNSVQSSAVKIQTGMVGLGDTISGVASKTISVTLSGFTATPHILLALQKVDANKDHNLRVETEAQNATKNGFNIKIATWGDSVIYGTTSVSYIAIGP
ncbi:MAG: hypothetical protein GY862_20875 [Gammaproteobacteria bacterium]|nr:hypothetical protein [Gammaproteobacteria bacterium]